jgi:DNA-binding NtrC family response regulator
MGDDRRKVLIVDDRLDWLCKCADLLTEHDYDVKPCRHPKRAMQVFRDFKPDAVLLDVMMPERSGLDILKDMKAKDPYVAVIMLSGYGTAQTVVKAMKLKADNFVDKNSDLSNVPIIIEKELKMKSMEIENAQLRAQQGSQVVFLKDIIGECPAMQRLKDEVRTYADSKLLILLTGPPGVGKDHVASALHYESSRRDHPFKNIRLPDLSEPLIESALFGHEKGAFTGAHERKEGILESAQEGTVLLNEFVELSPHLQTKLLGVVESYVFSRVGGEGTDLVTHVRFLAATNADVNVAVADKRLREDLLWRLKQVWIRIPPLKERGDDILLLAEHMIAKKSRELGRSAFSLSERAEELLMRYHWPGNVRELKNYIEVAIESGRRDLLDPPGGLHSGPGGPVNDNGGSTLRAKVKMVTEQVEKSEIEAALRRFGGSRKKAADHLGTSYRDLLYKMKKYRLRDRF